MPTASQFAPLCLFTYKRLKTLQATVFSLQANAKASLTDLYIFSDAARGAEDLADVLSVRNYLPMIRGFRSVTLHFAKVNKGLAASIIEGVTEVIDRYGRVIVVEDDLLLAPNFLDFMNSALDFYKDHPLLFSVSGYSSPIAGNHPGDVYFTRRASSWGWGSWRDRWEKIDWSTPGYCAFVRDRRLQREFNRMGSDLSGMLKKQMRGKINSWAIRWTFHQFNCGLFTVFPFKSKISNEGFGERATHTLRHHRSRFFTLLDDGLKKDFDLPESPFLDKGIIRQFTRPYSLKTRVLYKLKNMLGAM